MAKHYCLIIDELFETVNDRRELKDHVKILVKAVHEAGVKQSARVFGVNKLSPSGFIKDRIREQKVPMIDYNPKISIKKST